LTSIYWQRGSFLVGKILINACILNDPFLIGIFLIRVNRGAQDVSLYTHAWRSSKAMLDPSQVSFSLLVSYLGVLVVLQMSSGWR